MTTINDIADLIRIIREDPAWAEALRSVLLSKELLELPETFAAFVSETRENFRLVHNRLEALETGQDALRADVTELKTDVAQLTTGQAELRADVTELKTGQAQLQASVARLETNQARMGGDLSRLTGRDYETYAARRAPLMAADLLKLDSIETLSITGKPRWIDDLALRAQLQSDITPAEALQLQATDLVLEGIVLPTNMRPSISLEPQATDPFSEGQGTKFYLLAEISMTIQESDLTRVTNRAAILQTVTGVRTQPLLTGAALEEGLDTADVMFLEIPDFA